MPPTVMIVDDEPLALRVVGLTLERRGYRVIVASHAYQALMNLKTVTPDLLILDIMMPVMDGYDLCRRIRSLPGFEHTPIIFLSSLSDMHSIRKGYEAGATGYVSKLRIHDELISSVNEILGKRAS